MLLITTFYTGELMKLHPNKLAISATVSIVILYLIYAAFMYFMPTSTADMLRSLMFLKDPTAPTTTYFHFTLANVASALVQTSISTYIFAYLIATIYNKLIG